MSKKFQWFTSYSGNVKEQLSNLSLGPLTAIVGDEATYKSAIVIGARLALTGKYEPVGAQPSDLLRLAANSQSGIDVQLSGPSGTAAWRLRVDPDTGKAKKPESPRYEGDIGSMDDTQRGYVIPTDSVRDLLKNARGERKLREAFINRFGGSLREVPEPIAMDADEQEQWTIALVECRNRLEEGASADALLAKLSEYFRKESGLRRREITPIEAFLKQKKARLSQIESEEGVTPELLKELETRLATAKAWETREQTLLDYESLKTELEAVKTEIMAAEVSASKQEQEALAKEKNLNARFVAAEKQKSKTFSTLMDVTGRVAAYDTLSAAYSRAVDAGATKCQFCPHDFGSSEPIQATQKFFEAKAAMRRAEKEKAEADFKQAELELETVRQELAKHDNWVTLQQQELRTGHDALRRRLIAAEVAATAAKEQIDKYSLPAARPSSTSRELELKIQMTKEAIEARTVLIRESVVLRKKEKAYDVLKKLEGEAIHLQKQVMTRVAKKASEEVSRGLPGGRTARLDPDSCEWYLTRPDGQEYGPFGALCGTEKTALILGLTAAWTRGSPLRVAIFDDEDMVGLSTKGIEDFRSQCESLYAQGDFTQVILVSNRPDLWIGQDGVQRPTCEKWHIILRQPRALTPLEVRLVSVHEGPEKPDYATEFKSLLGGLSLPAYDDV